MSTKPVSELARETADRIANEIAFSPPMPVSFNTGAASRIIQSALDQQAEKYEAALDGWKKLADWSELIAILEAAGVKQEDHGFLRGGKDRTPEDATRELVSQRDQLRSALKVATDVINRAPHQRGCAMLESAKYNCNCLKAAALAEIKELMP